MAMNPEVVASLATFLANDRQATIDDLIRLLCLALNRHPDAIAVAIDKGITMVELCTGIELALWARLIAPAPPDPAIGGDGESLKPINQGR
jgi:hypothetical protein